MQENGNPEKLAAEDDEFTDHRFARAGVDAAVQWQAPVCEYDVVLMVMPNGLPKFGPWPNQLEHSKNVKSHLCPRIRVRTRMVLATTMVSNHMADAKFFSLDYFSSGVAPVGLAAFFYKKTFDQKHSPCFLSSSSRSCLVNNFKRMTWSIRSSINDSSFNSSSSDGGNGRTRLIRAIQGFQSNLGAKIQEVKKNLPMKLLFFLVGFYCATAFATVIGQTGDWDVLSAALAVIVVEGIGALMYGSSLPFGSTSRSLITMFNYWKAGLTLGLFLDSFKY
ncbi:hypothetical protein L6164_000770 [Bauhinia variegata]|uniref:Uncharacterized protein n=1 Tax=Bauhinia variegata TaxID=167791 RepID=A0ACB9Q9Q4_BAUVA|nr:hypothetical protein L6164_000770 [Bauhinia variegata]